MEKKYLIIFFFLTTNLYSQVNTVYVFDYNNFEIKTNCYVAEDTGLVFGNKGRATLSPNLAGCFEVRIKYKSTDDASELLTFQKRNALFNVRTGTAGEWRIYIADSVQHQQAQNPIVFDYFGLKPLFVEYIEFKRMICELYEGEIDTLYSPNVKVVWDMNSETDLAGYKVYWNGNPKNYLFNKSTIDTTLIIDDLELNQFHYLTVTAIDSSGNESDFSTEKCFVLKQGDGDKTFDGIVDYLDQLWFSLSFGSLETAPLYDEFFNYDQSTIEIGGKEYQLINYKDQLIFDNQWFGKIWKKQ